MNYETAWMELEIAKYIGEDNPANVGILPNGDIVMVLFAPIIDGDTITLSRVRRIITPDTFEELAEVPA